MGSALSNRENMNYIALIFYLFGFAECKDGTLFSEPFKIEPTDATVDGDHINFGATMQSFIINDQLSLVVGAPKEGENGKLHLVSVDKFNNIDQQYLQLKCTNGKSLSEWLTRLMFPRIAIENNFFGSTVQLIGDSLWLCDSRSTVKSVCTESFYDEKTETWIEKTAGGCKGLKTSRTETDLPQNEEILRDFFIGGCYVIKDFKNNIKSMIRDGIDCDDNLAWINPCFTYNDNRELNYLNYLDGNLTTGIRGSKYDMGFGNMNCRFGTSVGTMGNEVLIGASNHMS